MWPTLFGSGWIWSALIAATLVCFITGVLGFLFAITVKPKRRTSDDVDWIWHRYEEGDLTRSEFDRRIGRRPAAGPMGAPGPASQAGRGR